MPVFLRWLLRLGPTNPITVRLVQNGSRRARHMYIRSAYLAVLILVLLWSLVVMGPSSLDYRELARNAAGSFVFVAYLQIALICVLAPVFMAGAIAQEANPRTWEVLLTTPLSSAQIVLGNLFGRLFFILALLVASLPLFALTQYFGGVPGRSILTSYLIAGCAALLVGTIAIALSVSRLVGRRAVFAFYVSVVSYLGATAGLDAFFARPGSVTWFTALNPFLTLRALLNPSEYAAAPPGSMTGVAKWFLETPVSTWCWGCVLISLFLMAASTMTVRLGGIAMVAGGGVGVPWYRRIFGLGGRGSEHRPPRHVWHNPIAWREAAARNSTLARILARWSFVTLGGIFGIGLVVAYHLGSLSSMDFRLAVSVTVGSELAVTTLVAINMAATAVSREREDGTLDLLLTTPITPSQYLAGKLRGLVAYLLPMLAVPIGTLAVAGLYAFVVGLIGDPRGSVGGMGGPAVPVVMPEAILLAPLVVIPFVAFCVMIGLQWSLKSKGTIGSVVATVGVAGAISGVVGLCAWQAAPAINVVGPVLAALSPASLVHAITYPEFAMEDTVSNASTGLVSARVSLLIGAVIAAALYVGIIYAMHANMVRTFDMTVRRLAGTR